MMQFFTRDIRIIMENTENLQSYAAQQGNALLRSVYLWMMIGLLISGATAFIASQTPAINRILFGNPYMIWALIAIELGLVIAISAAINKISLPTARALFLLFSFIDGLTFAVIFLVYTETSIATTFFIASGMFGVMSLYGYFTDKDLSAWGTFLFMGLIGIIIAIIVNFFLQSPMLNWVVSVIGVIIFTGLTAYDTQKIRQLGEEMSDETGAKPGKIAIIGALSLYLDFINLFLMLLQFFGRDR